MGKKASKKPTRKPKAQYVIVRADRAGVFAGELVEKKGSEVTLNACRRLWYWKARSGVALSGVAIHGLAPGSKVDAETARHCVLGVIEIIPCSAAAEGSIRGA